MNAAEDRRGQGPADGWAPSRRAAARTDRSALATVRQAFASADQTRAATELLGALITVAFAVSFTTALQRVYLRAWRRPPGGGVRNKGRAAVWVGGFVALLIMLSLLRGVFGQSSGPAVSWAVGLIGSIGLCAIQYGGSVGPHSSDTP